jgi:hypothetical protein
MAFLVYVIVRQLFNLISARAKKGTNKLKTIINRSKVIALS